MMAEYIERKRAIVDACNSLELYPSEYAKLEDALNKIPTADVAPVRHGRWVDRIVDENEVIQPWMERYYCSECLEGGNQSWFKFCPNCGVKMDGGDGNSDMA